MTILFTQIKHQRDINSTRNGHAVQMNASGDLGQNIFGGGFGISDSGLAVDAVFNLVQVI